MGAIGDSYDNAMAESLWASLEKELIYRTTFSTREEARTAIFAFINWYEKTRRGSGISRRFSSNKKLGFKPHS
jgi:transposase InsO family protein